MADIVDRLDNGVVVYQVTDSPHIKSNIYCERPYSSDDGRRFLYARQMDEEGADWEYVLCEFGSWEERVVGRGALSVTVSYDNDFYYLRPGEKDATFHRIDLGTGESEVVLEMPEGMDRAGHPAVSPDGRTIAFQCNLSFDPQMFGIELADTQTGERRLFHQGQDLCNTHLQFEPGEGDLLQVQHNRGCEFTPDGTRLKLVGEEGATFFLLDIRDGAVTRMRCGKPYTTPLTGHQTWVSTTQDSIMTVKAEGEFGPEKGNILLIRAGEDYRQIGKGWIMNHIGCTPCGRYFHADGLVDDAIIVGSPKTGRTRFVCNSHSAYGRKGFGQQAHPHAYLTTDFRWVVFNSDRTGTPQTYAAKLPDGFLDGLD